MDKKERHEKYVLHKNLVLSHLSLNCSLPTHQKVKWHKKDSPTGTGSSEY